jgi:hypothetical protein
MESFYSVMLCFSGFKKWSVFFLLAFTGGFLFAQGIPEDTLPFGHLDPEGIKPVRFSKLDNQKLLREELEKRKNGSIPAFAISRNTQLSPFAHGVWRTSEDGQREIWRIRIQSPGALSLNLGITDFYLPPRAKLWIYHPSLSQVEGPFDYGDNEAHGQLWTPVIEGEEVVLEVSIPSDEKKWLKLTIAKLNHDFQGIFSLLSGNCHLDVACGSKEGWNLLDHYRDLMRSVGMFTINGRNFCSGALINNGKNDCTPYFLSAFHCDVNVSNAPSVVVYWNYENSGCRPISSSANSRAGDGIKTIFNSGAIFRAGFAPSDFILLELDDPVKEAAHPYFAGWNASAAIPEDTLVCIHHPNTQEKRISITFRKIYRGQWGQLANEVPTGNHLIVPRWDIGTTEDGSSGGPLINNNKQIIGQLHGGSASCSNNGFDAFGWFYSSWIGGGSPINRLSEWLDPENKGIKIMPGRSGTLCGKGLAISTGMLNICLPDSVKVQVFAGSGFLNPVTLDVRNAPSGISCSFDPMTIPPGGTSTLTMASGPIPIPNEVNLQIRGISGRDTVFAPLSLFLNNKPGKVILKSVFTGREIEPKLSWFKLPGVLRYQIEIARDSLFSQMITNETISDTSYTLKGLEYDKNYFYRLRAKNDCGESPDYTSGSFLTPLDLRLQFLDLENVFCLPSDFKAGLKIGAGFSGPLNVAFSMVPALPSWKFSAQGVDKNLFKLSATGVPDSLKSGNYQVNVVVSDGRNSAAIGFDFRLKGLPPTPKLQAPGDNEVLLTPRPQISWATTTTSESFAIRVAKDLQFQEVIFAGERNFNFYKFSVDLQSGAYYWQITSKNDCGEKASEIRKFKLNLNDLGSIFRWQIAVEPNPVTDRVNIHLSEKLSDITINLYSIEGKLLASRQFTEAENHFSFDLHSYPPAVYIVRIFYKQGSYSKRVVKNSF